MGWHQAVHDALTLAPILGVPRRKCTLNSTRWLMTGSTTEADKAAAHAGSHFRNACVTDPTPPEKRMR